MATITHHAPAQIATLDKGHQLLVGSGLQIWGLNTDSAQYPFNYNNFTAANMNAVMWSHGQSNPGVLSAGQRWGKWVDYLGIPATALNATETAHYADLVAIQVGDEQQSDIENPTGATKAWFDAAHSGNLFTDKLLYVNSTFVNDVNAYINFVASANPDALSWDAYPFGTTGVSPYNWLGKSQIFRRVALGGAIGAHGAPARPFGLYLQTYHGGDGARDPGDLEMRWQQFTAWTLGYTFVDAFTAGGGNTSLFNSGDGNSPTQPRYNQFKETSRQSLNLGPALTKLISSGYGPQFIAGKDPSGNTNARPIDWPTFNRDNAPINQRYLTSVSAVNLGIKNNGNPGDVYVGFFNPLHATYGDPAGTAYFMATNALGAYLQDPSLLVGDCQQQLTLNFDFGVTGINSLERLNRNTGLVEVINTSYSDGGNTVFTSLGSGKFQLQLKLDGGSGDLFKYNDGTAFVGVEAGVPVAYWDNDANAANNDVATGAGLGGAGAWDSGPKWYNGSTDTAYVASSNVVFTGTAGVVSFTAPQSVTSIQFKTTGYTVSGSSLTLTGPTIATDAGVTATINAPISGTNGLIKNGPGTLNLQSVHNYTGNTTINEGVLSIANASLGVAPSPSAPNVQINNGATLRFSSNEITLSSARMVVMGSGGGTIDTNGNNATIAGAILGATLTKVDGGTLTINGKNSYSSTTINGGAVAIGHDGALGTAPSTFTPGNITFDNGTLRFNSNITLQGTRGITINAGGGTIDTQGFSDPSGYNASQGGFRGPGNLTKLGSGTFFAAATTGGANVSWTGRLILKEGTWKIVASDGLPYNAPVADGLQPAQVTLDGGTWQTGATINVTNARRGVTVAAGGGTIDTQSFNFTWAGPWAGSDASAIVNKIGSGILRLNSDTTYGPATYAGTFNVNAGTLQLDGSTAMGDLASINLANATGVTLVFSGGNGETIGSLAGGGSNGGNVTLPNILTTGGNNNSTTFGGVISGAGGLRKSGMGNMRLTGANTFASTTFILGGTLTVDGSLASPVNVGNGSKLAGTGDISGAVTVSNAATIAPGEGIAELEVGSLSLASGSILDFDLDTLVGFVDISDRITAAGNLTISGGTINLNNAANMSTGVYKLIDYSGTLNGSFNNLALGIQPAGFAYNLINNTTDKSIDLAVSMPGDFNRDDRVDGADYVVWRKGLGTTFTQSDYDVWRSHFGQSAGIGTSESGAVPEPGAWMLLIVAAATLPTRFGRLPSQSRY